MLSADPVSLRLAALHENDVGARLAAPADARDAAQVAPLMPPAGSTLLVTLRFRFVIPGLHAKKLDTLPRP
ncbi:MAG: hypothetical protein ACRD3T_14465 [Terriglobia bacterium]